MFTKITLEELKDKIGALETENDELKSENDFFHSVTDLKLKPIPVIVLLMMRHIIWYVMPLKIETTSPEPSA